MRDFVSAQECLTATRYCLCSKASKSNQKEGLYNTYVYVMTSLKRIPGAPGYYTGPEKSIEIIKSLCEYQFSIDSQNKQMHISPTYEEELCM